MGKKFTILAFVGGGIRGLMSVTILNRLYQYKPSILTSTDLIAGCSTGSIITSELVGGTTPPELIQMFTGGELTFYDKMNTNPSRPAYPIDEAFGSQAALNGDKKVADLAQKVLFVTFNVGGIDESSGIMVPKPWAPVMYTNMLMTEHPEYADVAIAKAAASSGAMPGQLGSFDGNVDGCFFNHDPTFAAIALAVKAGNKLEDIVAITIGTGYMPDWIATDTHDWGAQQWMNGVPDPFDNTPPFLMNQTQPGPVLDMSLNGTSTKLMPDLVRLMLGDTGYSSINPTLPCFIPENSTYPQAISLLQSAGQNADITEAQALLDAYWPDTQAQTSAKEKQ